MQIKIIAFGIARDILSASKLDYELEDGATIAELKTKLISDYPDFDRLRSLAFAINKEYVTDENQINASDEVVLIPPVSGG